MSDRKLHADGNTLLTPSNAKNLVLILIWGTFGFLAGRSDSGSHVFYFFLAAAVLAAAQWRVLSWLSRRGRDSDESSTGLLERVRLRRHQP